jgi:hypothetical protein
MTALETLRTRLSLAVRVRDDFTDQDARGTIAVTVTGNRSAIRNLSGYYLFLDLDAGPTTVDIVSSQYLPASHATSIPLADPLDPVLEEVLLPRWTYPFPAGTTRVTGLVKDAAGAGVAGADVSGLGRPTRSDADGRFVAYFRALGEDDIEVVVAATSRRRLVKAGDGTTTFQLTLAHPTFQALIVSVADLEEGEERHLGDMVLTPL